MGRYNDGICDESQKRHNWITIKPQYMRLVQQNEERRHSGVSTVSEQYYGEVEEVHAYDVVARILASMFRDNSTSIHECN